MRIIVTGAVFIAVNQIGAIQLDLPVILEIILDPVAGALAGSFIFEIVGIILGLQIGIDLVARAIRVLFNAADYQIVISRPAFRADYAKAAGSQRIDRIRIDEP
ncbi:MAG: hypothetical protein IJB91_03185 [Oscillospiraceae bacterium]|nr:hypothetical protein [Oscillospiraceae bacterium]MBQ3146716.1 hypothetical protein [Oscillospiraceae bacterium]